jgi:O-succinylbenzoic acid--CoA ligase
LEDGEIAPPKQAGEIIVKGPNVTMGYLYRPEVTKEKFNEGWFHTGDIGYLDEEGFLYVLDRRSDLIISGGENIYPAEIESVLLAHPDVADAGITGYADVTKEELKQFCLENLAKYKVPKTFHFIEKLPRNAAKKLLRRKLCELV